MNLSDYKLLKLLTIIFLFSHQFAISQTKGIIIDLETNKPIPFVSIYTKSEKNVNGVSSNSHGLFEVNFPFKMIYFKHINYGEISLSKEDLKDTVFLYPNKNTLSEVVVASGQKPWITKLLQDVIKQKGKNYNPENTYFKYDYKTYSLSDSSGYAFKSNGNLSIPNVFNKEYSQIDPKVGVIKYKDNTAGCDFSNLQKMLYEDKFIQEFTKRFLKSYYFRKSTENEELDKNLITFYFKSKKYDDDRGSITIDSINKAIVEYRRISGTEFNVKSKTNFVFRNFASNALGFDYKEMQSEIYVKYIKNNNFYCLSESNIKGYISSVRRKKGKDELYFSSTESQLKLQPIEYQKGNQWITLPKPFYIGIETKKDRLAYEALQKIIKKYEDFDLK